MVHQTTMVHHHGPWICISLLVHHGPRCTKTHHGADSTYGAHQTAWCADHLSPDAQGSEWSAANPHGGLSCTMVIQVHYGMVYPVHHGNWSAPLCREASAPWWYQSKVHHGGIRSKVHHGGLLKQVHHDMVCQVHLGVVQATLVRSACMVCTGPWALMVEEGAGWATSQGTHPTSSP